jgi:hypothetical protein
LIFILFVENIILKFTYSNIFYNFTVTIKTKTQP